MTRCDLAFAYAELSKFVQLLGPEHLKVAELVLQFLRGTYKDHDGLTYSDDCPARHNLLLWHVDSDYASA